MTPQTFSLEMSRHLSSLVPGFEGHWNYIARQDQYGDFEPAILCYSGESRYLLKRENYICPAWQVEDALRNMLIIAQKIDKSGGLQVEIAKRMTIHIANMIVFENYQKIEEYLWSVLK